MFDNNEIDLSGKAASSTMGGIANGLGWLALGVLALVTAAHAIFITMQWANLDPADGDIFAILAVIGVALVEVFAVLIAVMFATHSIRAKQKPVAIAIEGLWFFFAGVNLISSFAMRHGGEPPAFVTYWVVFGLPIAGLVVGGLFYIVKRLNPDAKRAEDMAELSEQIAHGNHVSTVEVLTSPQMRAVQRQAAWQRLPSIIGRQLNLTDAQIAALERQAPALLDLNQNGVPDVQETQPQPARHGGITVPELQDLIDRGILYMPDHAPIPVNTHSEPSPNGNGRGNNGIH